VCFRKESESTMPNENPKHASDTPPVSAFGIGGHPKNWLVPVILLSLREWNSYGYELMGRARMFGFGAMNPGTLYRTLRQMEKDGVVESSWETSRGGAGASDVRYHRLRRGIPGRLG
jgi:PadR family transcriptional regulator